MAEASKPVTIGCIAIFTAPLWVTGIVTVVQALQQDKSLPLFDQVLPILTGFGLIIVGIVPILLVMAAIKLEPQREALYKEIRAIPAHWKPQWSASRLVDQTVETGAVIGKMMIFWAAVSLVFGFFAFVAVRQGAWAGLVLLIVPLVLVGFVVVKIRGSMRRKRFGKSELALDEMPAHIGETLRGSIIIEKLRPEAMLAQTFDIRLTSIRRKTWT